MQQTELKKCLKCGLLKPLSNFSIRSDTKKYRNECKDCRKNYHKIYNKINHEKIYNQNKKYREQHKKELDDYRLNWQRNNKDKVRKYHKKYMRNLSEEQKILLRMREKRYRDKLNQNKNYIEHRRELSRQSAKRRRRKITAYEEDRKKKDPIFKLKKQLRNEIRSSFQRRGLRKSTHTEDIIGCKMDFLYIHLLTTFKNTYSLEWDGIEPVHIDHIQPLAIAKTEQDVLKLCRWNNLQLLRAQDNLLKGASTNKLNTSSKYHASQHQEAE